MNCRNPVFIATITFIFLWIQQIQTNCQSKNLVLNPGFERYEECPKSHNPENQSHKLVPGWSYPTFAAPDYFNKCASTDAGVPNNFAGISEPKEGKGYVGAILTGTEESRRVSARLGRLTVRRRRPDHVATRPGPGGTASGQSRGSARGHHRSTNDSGQSLQRLVHVATSTVARHSRAVARSTSGDGQCRPRRTDRQPGAHLC